MTAGWTREAAYGPRPRCAGPLRASPPAHVCAHGRWNGRREYRCARPGEDTNVAKCRRSYVKPTNVVADIIFSFGPQGHSGRCRRDHLPTDPRRLTSPRSLNQCTNIGMQPRLSRCVTRGRCEHVSKKVKRSTHHGAYHICLVSRPTWTRANDRREGRRCARDCS
jgi:hypothetical protein